MIKRFVRQRLFSIWLSGSLCWAVSVVAPIQSFSAELPPIEAHRFQSTPLEISKSSRVYLFKTTERDLRDLPKVGNLVLIYSQNKPSMAFRVLKTDLLKFEYVAKRVRRYEQTETLKFNSPYASIEKVSDLLPAPPAETLVTMKPRPVPQTAAVVTEAPALPEPTPTAVAEDNELGCSAGRNDHQKNSNPTRCK